MKEKDNRQEKPAMTRCRNRPKNRPETTVTPVDLRAAAQSVVADIERMIAPRGQALSSLMTALQTRECGRSSRPQRRLFFKQGALEQLEAEAYGLALLRLAACNSGAEDLFVPRIHAILIADDCAALAIEFLELRRAHGESLARFGRALGRLHALPVTHFGAAPDNFIGPTPQHNPDRDNWPDFFAEFRLSAIADALTRSARGANSPRLPVGAFKALDQLCSRIHTFFDDREVVPAYVHGDLWSGNYGALPNGRPCFFDPAAHAADPEVDLAMIELFGSPGAEFFAAYDSARTIDCGFHRRKPLYNLYHLLNHCLLFGGRYCTDAADSIQKLLLETDR
ncbi:MAG: fructosamine kinase family protein [Thioalkalivibrionaceae bacterium]